MNAPEPADPAALYARVFPQGSPEPESDVEAVRYAGAPKGGVHFERQGIVKGRPSRAIWIARGPNGDGRRCFWSALTHGGPLVDVTGEVNR